MSDAECRRLARALAADPSDETVLEALLAAERRAGIQARVRVRLNYSLPGPLSGQVLRWGAEAKAPPLLQGWCVLGVATGSGRGVEAWPWDQFGEGLGLPVYVVVEVLPGTDGAPGLVSSDRRAETQPPSVSEDAPRSPASSPPPPAPAPAPPARPRPRAGLGRSDNCL